MNYLYDFPSDQLYPIKIFSEKLSSFPLPFCIQVTFYRQECGKKNQPCVFALYRVCVFSKHSSAWIDYLFVQASLELSSWKIKLYFSASTRVRKYQINSDMWMLYQL